MSVNYLFAVVRYMDGSLSHWMNLHMKVSIRSGQSTKSVSTVKNTKQVFCFICILYYSFFDLIFTSTRENCQGASKFITNFFF